MIKETKNTKKRLYPVKLKASVNEKKVRKVFLRSKDERAAFINTILKAQGYNS